MTITLKQWVDSLREQGVCAAHPDDGWVNRDKDEVQFVYPQFMDGASKGSVVALGWPDKHRLVELTGLRTTAFGSQIWSFRATTDCASRAHAFGGAL